MLTFKEDQMLLILLDRLEQDKKRFNTRLEALSSKIDQLAKEIEATSIEFSFGQVHSTDSALLNNQTLNP